MSASPIARQPQSIPAMRRVVINHESEMPSDYGTTPGGTIFGTTPGGTRIVYERSFLLQMRQSPLARTPPANLPIIPGVTAPKESSPKTKSTATQNNNNSNNASKNGSVQNGRSDSPTKNRVPASIKEEEEQFSMDM